MGQESVKKEWSEFGIVGRFVDFGESRLLVWQINILCYMMIYNVDRGMIVFMVLECMFL